MRRKMLLAAAGMGLGLAMREWMQRRREASLQMQAVLITGGSRGLGFMLAQELAREGCRLALCARDESELQRAKAALEQQAVEEQRAVEVFTVPCNITDRAQVERMIEAVTRHFGGLDMLINNAGIITAGPLSTMTVDDFEDAMQVMFWGAVYPTMAVLPQMRRRRSGRIVNITSIGGKVSVPHLLPYSTAKFAAVGLSEGLRAELAKDGINVTTVCPGLMRTGSFLHAYIKGQRETEFTLFSLLDNVPIVSMSAAGAARRIVQAIKRNESEIVLTLPAKLQALMHGVFPGKTADLLGVVNRFLPEAGDGEPEEGQKIQERMNSPLLNTMTSLGLMAAEKLNQHPVVAHTNGYHTEDPSPRNT